MTTTDQIYRALSFEIESPLDHESAAARLIELTNFLEHQLTYMNNEMCHFETTSQGSVYAATYASARRGAARDIIKVLQRALDIADGV